MKMMTMWKGGISVEMIKIMGGVDMKKNPLLKNFRIALKAVVKDEEGRRGRGVKSKLARDSEISRAYLNDIANEKKPGSEQVRHRISGALGYSYSDFQLLGDVLFKGSTLEDAKRIILNNRLMRPNEDGYIEKILKIWPSLSDKEKVNILQYSQKQQFNCWKKHKKLAQFARKSEERFSYIWGQVCIEEGAVAPFDAAIFELLRQYKLGEISDIDVFQEAAVFAGMVP